MISVIGAGPAGSFYASKEEEEVHLFEEHEKVGIPVACTGILTDSISRVTTLPKDLEVSQIKRFRMHAPNAKSIVIDLKKTNHVYDRAKLDQYLFQKAVDHGATVHLGERFLHMKEEGKQIAFQTTKKKYVTDTLVGADGPFSQVAQSAGLYGKRQFVKGWQARCKFPELEEGTTEIYLGLGEFSWVVPEDNKIARVGVIGMDTQQLRRDYEKLLGASSILEDQSGIIPLYNPKQKLSKGNVFLLGDAATQVKATTYGGIIYGMIAGGYLAENKATYAKRFGDKLGKDLWVSLKMREYMNAMNEKQCDDLIDIFQKQGNAEILASHDRDFPSKFIVQLLMKETKLWKLGFGLFKNKMVGK